MTNIALFTLMLFAGIGIPIMAAMNAGLGTHLNSTIAAVVVLCCVALAASLALLMATGRPSWGGLMDAPRPLLLGGFVFIFYIGAITYCAPRIGLGNAVVMVLFGQLISAAIIDHFGMFGAPQAHISLQRLAGLGLVGVGIVFAQRGVNAVT
ncbi:MAG: DMT family transporter [Pseudomonadota bacterium]